VAVDGRLLPRGILPGGTVGWILLYRCLDAVYSTVLHRAWRVEFCGLDVSYCGVLSYRIAGYQRGLQSPIELTGDTTTDAPL